jgi:hypothetical protein
MNPWFIDAVVVTSIPPGEGKRKFTYEVAVRRLDIPSNASVVVNTATKASFGNTSLFVNDKAQQDIGQL